jgi:replicative superfamily II helicase
VRFVALSATIGNANFIGEWFAEVRGPTAIIVENERPIQLHNHVAVVRRGQSAPRSSTCSTANGSRMRRVASTT